MKLIDKIKSFIEDAKKTNPVSATKLFLEVRDNKPYQNKALKRAILFGKMYFYSTPMDNKQINYNARAEYADKMIEKYCHPTNRIAYIKDLQELKACVDKAEQCGFFSVAGGIASKQELSKQNKIEAGYYDEIMTCLDSLILNSRVYPFIWRKTFLKRT